MRRSDSFLATLPSLRLNDVRISEEMVHDNERMLTGGFYAEVELGYDATIAQEKNGRPFAANRCAKSNFPSATCSTALSRAGRRFTAEWKNFLMRSIGMEPEQLSPRARDMTLLRMVPFVERNYNMVELGPRGTGKSHLFQQVSPYAHLISGGKATVARMFVNNANGQRGLVCQYDVVCFDEVSGVSFDQKDGVNIMKGYMESGEFSRGRESIRADGGIVMVGNFDVDVQHQQRVGHLFGPLPPEMRNDTAFMDRIHAYLPGWDLPKVSRDLLTDHFGLVSDFLSECLNRLRRLAEPAKLPGARSLGRRACRAATQRSQKDASGLIKLVHPDASPFPTRCSSGRCGSHWSAADGLRNSKSASVPPSFVTRSSATMGDDGVEKFVVTPELYSENSIGSDPLPPGRPGLFSPGGHDDGAFRIEVTEGPGSGVRS